MISRESGTELGEAGYAATAVAPAPHGASAHANHEPVASGSSERRAALQEEAVEGARTRAIGNISASPLGESTTRGFARVAGSPEPDDCPTDASDRAGSGEVPASAPPHDASWGGYPDGLGLRTDYRRGRTISVREADCVLLGVGAVRGVERRTTQAGTYHQARQFSAALLISGGGASHNPHDSGMAQ